MLDRRLFSNGADQTLYVEDVFSTYLYTGNGSTQTINNGLNMSAGGMVWTKRINSATDGWHFIIDSVRGATKTIWSNSALNEITYGASVTGFTSSGYTVGTQPDVNGNLYPLVSWGFRTASKFFDIVRYTGTGSAQTIAHNLGVAPGCIMVKRLDTSADWRVYNRGMANTDYAALNTNTLKTTDSTVWDSTSPTSTGFTVGTNTTVNASGGTYVAYLFAHDASSTGIIQCGAFTINASGVGTVDFGWEPQWILVKRVTVSASGSWEINDSMRGLQANGANYLYANLTNAEVSYPTQAYSAINSTSLTLQGQPVGSDYIYIAIRRGPMKTPTVGTSVFMPVARTGTGANATVTSGFVTDTVIEGNRASSTPGTKFGVWDRLRYANFLITTLADAEVAGTSSYIQTNPWDLMTGYKVGTTSTLTNASSNTFVDWMFRRAPGFFDVVTYTGNGVAGRAVNHNLGVKPEAILVKSRSLLVDWRFFFQNLGGTDKYYGLTLNSDSNSLVGGLYAYAGSVPTASQFFLDTTGATNSSGTTYVAYLFASCPGVSKIGTYTGNGSNQIINCGFSSGARFVLIKRTDATANWLVFDTARGITTTQDPYLALNSANAEDWAGALDSIDPDSTGFKVDQIGGTDVNVNGSTYTYIASA